MNAAGTALRRRWSWPAAAAAAVLVAWAAAAAPAVAPHTSTGAVALIGPPAASTAAAALAVLVATMATRAWPIIAPLAVLLAPMLLPGVAGAWIYAGAGALVVWALTLLVAASAWPWQASLSPRAHTALAGLGAAAWLAGVAAGVAPYAVTGDAPHYLTIARSLLDDGDVNLKDDYDERSYREFYGGSLEPRHTNPSPWGEEYSFHGLGAGVLATPGFAVAGVTGAVATQIALMALGAALIWRAAWRLLQDAGAAWFGCAALTLAAPYGLHAAAIYPDGPAAVPVAAAIWLAVRLSGAQSASLPAIAAVGAGLATLPWLHVRLALPAGIWGLALAVLLLRGPAPRWPRLAWLFAVPVISLAGWLAATQVMFGTWDPTAAMLQRTAPGDWRHILAGLLGLAADHQYGLLVAMPVAAGAVPGAWRVLRRLPITGVAALATVVGVVAMASAWVWWGGDSAPARFLTVTLPVVALWLAHTWASTGPGGRRLLLVALAFSAALTVAYAGIDGGARAYAFPDGRGSIFDAFSSSVDLSLALPSAFRDGESTRDALELALVWALVIAVAAWAAARAGRGMRDDAALACASVVVLTGGMVSAEIAWRRGHATPWTPATAALAVARAVPGAWGSVGGDAFRPRRDVPLGGTRLSTPESVPAASPTLLHVPGVPAGRYALRTADTGAADRLRLELGRDAWPYAEWPGAAAPPMIDLRTALHSIRVTGPAPLGRVWLEPQRIGGAAAAGEARRVTRVPAGDLYSMDDGHYAEPTGAWTGGDRVTRLIVVPPDGVTHLELGLEAGPARVEVRVQRGAAITVVRLEPQARDAVPFDRTGDDEVFDLTVDVRGGFPAAALGAASDSRSLGVWLDLSAAAPRR